MTISSDSKWNTLVEENELAFFRAGVCLGSRESFSLEEKAAICDDMEATNKAIEDATRKNFEAMPPEFQARLFNMLCAFGCMTSEWWRDTLLGAMPANRPAFKSESYSDVKRNHGYRRTRACNSAPSQACTSEIPSCHSAA